MNIPHCKKHSGWQRDFENCRDCIEVSLYNSHIKRKSICYRCLRETTDQKWFGSACFKGTCKPAVIWDDTFQFELENRRPRAPDWRWRSAYAQNSMRSAGR